MNTNKYNYIFEVVLKDKSGKVAHVTHLYSVFGSMGPATSLSYDFIISFLHREGKNNKLE